MLDMTDTVKVLTWNSRPKLQHPEFPHEKLILIVDNFCMKK